LRRHGGDLLLSKRPSAFGLAGMTFILIWSVITVLALVWGVEINMYDDYHIQYGFPMIWAVHQLVTIAGPVDIWHVDFSALLINVTFWLASIIVGIVMVRYLMRSTRKQRHKVQHFSRSRVLKILPRQASGIQKEGCMSVPKVC